MLSICKKFDPYKLLIFDVETVRHHENLPTDPNDASHQAWKYLRRKEYEDCYDSLNQSYRNLASLYPEFCRAVAISFCHLEGDGKTFRVAAFSDRDEKQLLDRAIDFIAPFIAQKYILAGMAIVGYDLPLLAKRCMTNNRSVPKTFDLSDRKPWEIEVFDLMPIWKMTSFTPSSLPLICHALGVESPKTPDLDGSLVGDLYFAPEAVLGDNLSKISHYCDGDVLAVGRIIQRMFQIV